MDQQTLARILYLKRLEEADTEGAELPDALRREGSAAAGGSHLEFAESGAPLPEEHAFLSRRSESLLNQLSENSLPQTAPQERWLSGLGVAMVGLALLLGFLASGFSNAREFNVLSSPFLGLILWNLVIFAALLIKWLLFRGKLGGLAKWLAQFGERKQVVSAADSAQAVAQADFQRQWFGLRLPARARHMAMWLHLAAAALAIGTVLSLYLRGLVTEYRAVWESTFLSESQREGLARIFYAPAAKLLGGWPDFSLLGGLDGAPAARWVHLGALTLVLLVVVPRLLLAVWSAYQNRKAWIESAASVGEDELRPYLLRLQKGLSGGSQSVVLLPYGKLPEESALKSVRALAEDVWGGGVPLEIQPAVAYGMEDSCLAERCADADHLLVFPLNATPEAETHGHLVSGLKGEGKLLIALDASGFEKKFRALPEYTHRLEQRLKAWRTLFDQIGVEAMVTGQEASPAGAVGEVATNEI